MTAACPWGIVSARCVTPNQEFENAEGDDYVTELSAQGSPAPQHGPEVYVLPLTKVSLPMAKQPGRSVQLLKSADLGRQSLLYLKEIGHGWFGKVFLGEVNSGISSTQVVVKELKASASVQDQMQFLEEAQPYRYLWVTPQCWEQACCAMGADPPCAIFSCWAEPWLPLALGQHSSVGPQPSMGQQ
nr:serine/threonine-protein kinase LMTK1 [Zonotrichia albicollis]